MTLDSFYFLLVFSPPLSIILVDFLSGLAPCTLLWSYIWVARRGLRIHDCRVFFSPFLLPCFPPLSLLPYSRPFNNILREHIATCSSCNEPLLCLLSHGFPFCSPKLLFRSPPFSKAVAVGSELGDRLPFLLRFFSPSFPVGDRRTRDPLSRIKFPFIRSCLPLPLDLHS